MEIRNYIRVKQYIVQKYRDSYFYAYDDITTVVQYRTRVGKWAIDNIRDGRKYTSVRSWLT